MLKLLSKNNKKTKSPGRVASIQTGQVLVVVLLVMTLVLTVTLTVNQAVLVHTKLTAENIKSEKAYYAAEAKVEELLYEVRQDMATPFLTPVISALDIEEEGYIRVSCSLSFNETETTPIPLGVGETLQFAVAAGDYSYISLEWGDENFSPGTINYPGLDVVYAGWTTQTPTPPAPATAVVDIHGQHLFFNPTPRLGSDFQFQAYLYSNQYTPTPLIATPVFDTSRPYRIRLKPYFTGAHGRVKISAWANTATPASVLEGLRTIDCTGEYLPNAGGNTVKRRVVVIANREEELLYDMFDYSAYAQTGLVKEGGYYTTTPTVTPTEEGGEGAG